MKWDELDTYLMKHVNLPLKKIAENIEKIEQTDQHSIAIDYKFEKNDYRFLCYDDGDRAIYYYDLFDKDHSDKKYCNPKHPIISKMLKIAGLSHLTIEQCFVIDYSRTIMIRFNGGFYLAYRYCFYNLDNVIELEF